jgi:hypothetical protein
MNPTIVIYHGNCPDGFGAVWSVRKFMISGKVENVTYYAAAHGSPPPDVTGMHVIMVDFSYKRPVIEDMIKKAATLLIIDHHKSAMEDLADIEAHNTTVIFDMKRSGAGMAWDFFHPSKERPWLIDYIEDMDLWNWKLENSKEVSMAIMSYPYDFEVWDRMADTPIGDFVRDGTAMLRKHLKDVEEVMKSCTREFKIKVPNLDHVVEVPIKLANVPYTYGSDIGAKLALEDTVNGIGGFYYDKDTPEGPVRSYSLRSSPTGLDVSAIARLYGGGGHRAAAAFRLPLNRIHELEK